MKHLFNFGISQDDAATEKAALEIKDGDRVICLASAGEVPLNLLAANDISIDAVDVSQEQICLSKLKLAAAIHLDQLEAARLIGYMPCTKMERKAYFERIAPFLNSEDQAFWRKHPEIFSQGPVHRARFERYLARFNKIVVLLMGRKRLLQFCELDDLTIQREVFDKQLRTGMISLIFKIAFHPRIYKNRGMDAEGLKHSGTRNIAEFFFSRFRDFFIATSARNNFHLQLTFFNKVLFKEALPLFLQDKARNVLRERSKKLTFYNISIEEHIEKSEVNQFNKFALSNIGDWLSHAAFTELVETILSRSNEGARIFLRYIHYPHALPDELSERINIEQDKGKSLEITDRYPFYNLVPMKVIN